MTYTIWAEHSSNGCVHRKEAESLALAGCLGSHNLVSQAWRIPGNPLVFRPLWKAEEHWVIVKDDSHSDRVDTLTCRK